MILELPSIRAQRADERATGLRAHHDAASGGASRDRDQSDILLGFDVYGHGRQAKRLGLSFSVIAGGGDRLSHRCKPGGRLGRAPKSDRLVYSRCAPWVLIGYHQGMPRFDRITVEPEKLIASPTFQQRDPAYLGHWPRERCR